MRNYPSEVIPLPEGWLTPEQFAKVQRLYWIEEITKPYLQEGRIVRSGRRALRVRFKSVIVGDTLVYRGYDKPAVGTQSDQMLSMDPPVSYADVCEANVRVRQRGPLIRRNQPTSSAAQEYLNMRDLRSEEGLISLRTFAAILFILYLLTLVVEHFA